MININEVIETNRMIEKENLDVRTITLGISLIGCESESLEKTCSNIYERITEKAAGLIGVAGEIEKEYAIPIVNKRISVTPVSIIGSSCCRRAEDYVEIARTLDRAAKKVGVNFLGGFSALPAKGMRESERLLIESIPEALSCTDNVCASVNLGSTKTGINMDAVALMGKIIKELLMIILSWQGLSMELLKPML